MAWRIDRDVVRGEIDNRTKGRVTGRLWLAGRAEPIELALAGNAWRDLAGRRLEFENPRPQPGDGARLAPVQSGVIGDCTASRKVKVPDIPREEIGRHYAARQPFPWHWGNSLYLEWYSAANGRVVLESADFRLTVDGEAGWEMTDEDEEAQRRTNAAAMERFVGRLDDMLANAADREEASPPADDPAEGPARPQTEDEAERLQAESDLLADRINARVEREGIEHYERIVEEELDRRRRERGEAPFLPADPPAGWYDGMPPETEAPGAEADAGLAAELRQKHPLAERAFVLAGKAMDEPGNRGWIPPNASPEHPVADLVSSIMNAAVKLAGALNGRAWPPDLAESAGTLVRLKRAGEFLDHALLSAEACAAEGLVDPAWLAPVEREVREIGAECAQRIAELRDRLARGFE